MRLLVEIFIVGALIYFGWEKPFKAWVDEGRERLPIKRAVVTPETIVPAPAAPTPKHQRRE